MRTDRRAGACLLLGLLLVSCAASATPRIQAWTAKNGARVYFVEAHELPIVDVQIVYAAGSARDPRGREGLALLTNSLLDEGAGGLHANEVAYEFERLGAQYGATASYDSASVSLRSLADRDKLGAALVNLKRVIAHPDFPDDAVERQRKRFLVSIQQKKQSPGALADDALAAAVYGDHPYARPIEGDERSIQEIRREDILAFHERYYTARNALIAMVGDLDARSARRIADGLAGAMGRGEAAAPVPPVTPLAEAKEARIPHPSAQMHVLLGQTGMRYGDPDYFPLYVGNHILGGGTLVSRLFEEIREQRGLSYSASSYFIPRGADGPFVAGLQTRADQSEEAVSVLRGIMNEFIQDGPTPEEMESAKRNITGGFPLRIDSNSEILAYVAVIGFYGLPLDYLDTFNSRIEAVTVEQVRDAFHRRIHPERQALVLVGPMQGAGED